VRADYAALAGQLLEGFLLIFWNGDMAHHSLKPFLEGKSGLYIHGIAVGVPAEYVRDFRAYAFQPVDHDLSVFLLNCIIQI
jgi:hypothetical protein